MLRYRICFTTALMITAFNAFAGSAQCGKEGVWIQILGSGGGELNDGRASASYLLWIDDHARLLVDPAPGAALRFDESGADFADLDAIVLSQLSADHASDLPAFILGSADSERDRPLPVLGPDGNDTHPSTRTFVERLIGPEGAFPDLKSYLTFRSGNYKVTTTNVPAAGSRRWARFGSDHLRLAAIPVHHGDIPTLAWRATIGAQSVTFGGDFNNDGNLMQTFAKGTDALIVHHALGETTRGEMRDRYVLPSQIGHIASDAGARMLILGHRMKRTRGVESQTEAKIREYFAGPLIFANELECWGL